jgi:large conductance mechanosensitive channel
LKKSKYYKGGKDIMKEFRAWITKGNIVDMAIGIIVGIAFGLVIASLVNDVIMPPIGLALGNVDFQNLFAVLKNGATAGPYASLAAAKAAGAVTINYGVFINTIINFIIIALILFFLVVRPLAQSAARKKAAEPAAAPPPVTKACPYCQTAIPVKASRCPNCTSQLNT